MIKFQYLLFCLLPFSFIHAQRDSAAPSRMIIVPFQDMMYFSDADPDIARFSKSNEKKVREEMRNNVDANIYHQLLAGFDAVSLMRAPSLGGSDDLNRIYRATRYAVYSRESKLEDRKRTGFTEMPGVKNFLDKFAKKKKGMEGTFWISDSAVMLAMIGDPELFSYLSEKYHEKYILFITQFEINTDHKNSIEWMKQDYSREFTVHYNLFDRMGNLLRAETLTLNGGNDNVVKSINDKYLTALARHLEEILVLQDR